jgi:hypothetical protein
MTEEEFARSVATAKAELMLKAIELEATGLPIGVIALAFLGLTKRWAASSPGTEEFAEFFQRAAGGFPSNCEKLGDPQTEYQRAIQLREAAQGLPPGFTRKTKHSPG